MSKDTFNPSSRGAAAPTKITYSAQDLAEMYMTSREDFLGLDMEEVTNGWNLNYIYDFLYYIRNVNLFDDIIDWIVACWQVKHQYYNSYDKVSDNDLELNYINFKAQLQFIKEKLEERFESERHTEELRKMMLTGYKNNAVNTQRKQDEVKPIVKTSTNLPVFMPKSETDIDYHFEISSLPETVRNKVLVSQEVFDVFVKQLNIDIWNTILINKGKYCDPLRFLCIKHDIVAQNMEREDFDGLLHSIIYVLKNEPSLMSSMGRSKLTSSQKIKRSLGCYDSPLKKHRDEVWQLIEDCKLLEEGLQPVYDAMKAEALAAQSEVYQE